MHMYSAWDGTKLGLSSQEACIGLGWTMHCTHCQPLQLRSNTGESRDMIARADCWKDFAVEGSELSCVRFRMLALIQVVCLKTARITVPILGGNQQSVRAQKFYTTELNLAVELDLNSN